MKMAYFVSLSKNRQKTAIFISYFPNKLGD